MLPIIDLIRGGGGGTPETVNIGGHQYQISGSGYGTRISEVGSDGSLSALLGNGTAPVGLQMSAALRDPRFASWLSTDDPSTKADDLVREIWKTDPQADLMLYGQQAARKPGGVDPTPDSAWFTDEKYWPGVFAGGGYNALSPQTHAVENAISKLGLNTPQAQAAYNQWTSDMSPTAQHNRNDPGSDGMGLGAIASTIAKFTPLAPVAYAYDAINALQSGNILGAGLSALGGYYGLTGGNLAGDVGSKVTSGLGTTVSDLANKAIGTGVLSAASSLGGGQGLGQSLQNGALSGLIGYGAGNLSNLYNNTVNGTNLPVIGDGASSNSGIVSTGNDMSTPALSDQQLIDQINSMGNSDLQNLIQSQIDSGAISQADGMNFLQGLSSNGQGYDMSGGTNFTNLQSLLGDQGTKQLLASANGTNISGLLSNGLQSLLGGSAGSNILATLGGAQGLGALGSSAYQSYLNRQFSQQQAQLANDMITKADPYSAMRQSDQIPFMKNMLEQAPGLLNTANQTGAQAGTMLNNPQYMDLLSKSYSDPLSVYNSPEMQALNDKFMGGIERRDAAAGRNSQYGARAVEAQNNFLTNALPQYRTGLIGSQGAQTQTANGLNSLFGNQLTAFNDAVKAGTPTNDPGAGAKAYGEMMSQANQYGTFANAPLLAGTNQALTTGANKTGTSGTNLGGLGSLIGQGIQGLQNLYNYNTSDSSGGNLSNGYSSSVIPSGGYNTSPVSNNFWDTGTSTGWNDNTMSWA